MKATVASERPSDAARVQFEMPATRPHLFADLSRMVWLHFACAPTALQQVVPFELDLREDQAFVSVIAGTMRRLRPQLANDVADDVPGLDGDQPFVALRVPVRFNDQPARYNLAWWSGGSTSPLLAARSYGLAARRGAVSVQHAHEHGVLNGSAVHDSLTLSYEAPIDPSASFEPAKDDSLDAFLLERYAILTAADRVKRVHWLWHRPWAQTGIDVRVTDDGLLRQLLPADTALVAAHYAPGACDVWVSRPLCVEGAACARVWGDLPSEAGPAKRIASATSYAS